MPGSIRVSNFASDLANVAGGLLGGKQREEDSNEAKALRERMAKMEEDKLAEQAREHDEASSIEKGKLALGSSQFQYLEGQDKRKQEEQHLHEVGLRQRLQQLSGGTPIEGLNLMGEGELSAQIQSKLAESARIKEIKEARQYDLSRQLEQIHRQQEMANTSMLSIRRLYNDTVTRIQTDPSLMQQYGMMLKASKGQASPEGVMQEMVKKLAGVDLWGQYMQAAQQVSQIGQMAYTVGGPNGNVTSPLAQKAVADALPFAAKSPEQQAAITADYISKIKSGQPVDMKAAIVGGVPVSSIAQSVGMQLDPTTGSVAAMPKAAPAPAAGAPAPAAGPSQPMSLGMPGMLPANAGRGVAAMGGAFAVAPPPTAMQGPGQGAVDPMTGQQLPPTPAAGGATVAPPASPMAPVAAPETFSGHGSTASWGAAGVPVRAPAPAPAPQMPANPAMPFTPPPGAVNLPGPGSMPAPTGDTTMSGESVPRIKMMLQNTGSLPQAESLARYLLNNGVAYDEVIQSAPMSLQPMLSAKLPKRIINTPMALPQLGAPSANPFTPATGSPFNKPLFTPPSV